MMSELKTHRVDPTAWQSRWLAGRQETAQLVNPEGQLRLHALCFRLGTENASDVVCLALAVLDAALAQKGAQVLSVPMLHRSDATAIVRTVEAEA